MKTYTAEISISKKDEHSFLVALIPGLSIPSEFQEDRDIMESDCAVIAASHCSDGKNLWAYVHLERGEKQTIGEALRDSCVEMGKWYWCNLYAQGADEIDTLRARVEMLEEALRKVRDYDCYKHPDDDIIAIREAAIKESENCTACQHAKKAKWPPSGLCNEHYRAVTRAQERVSQMFSYKQTWGPREIARRALEEK